MENQIIFPLFELFWYFITNYPRVISSLVPVNRKQNQIITNYLDQLTSKSNDLFLTMKFFIVNDIVVGLKNLEYEFDYGLVKLACKVKSIRVMTYIVKYRNFKLIDVPCWFNTFYFHGNHYYILRGLSVSLIKAFIEVEMGCHLINLLESYNGNESLSIAESIFGVFEEHLINKKNVNVIKIFVKQYFNKYYFSCDCIFKLLTPCSFPKVFPNVYVSFMSGNWNF